MSRLRPSSHPDTSEPDRLRVFLAVALPVVFLPALLYVSFVLVVHHGLSARYKRGPGRISNRGRRLPRCLFHGSCIALREICFLDWRPKQNLLGWSLHAITSLQTMWPCSLA